MARKCSRNHWSVDEVMLLAPALTGRGGAPARPLWLGAAAPRGAVSGEQWWSIGPLSFCSGPCWTIEAACSETFEAKLCPKLFGKFIFDEFCWSNATFSSESTCWRFLSTGNNVSVNHRLRMIPLLPGEVDNHLYLTVTVKQAWPWWSMVQREDRTLQQWAGVGKRE
jgi:hypothetical protein